MPSMTNLRNLGLDHLDVVNLRVGGISEPREESIAASDHARRTQA